VQARVLGIAGGIAAVLYLMLDSGVLRPEAAPRVVSVSLLVLTVIFGVGSWTASISGQAKRSSMLAGLAIGAGSYAVFRAFAF
jgi:hypothetical protein